MSKNNVRNLESRNKPSVMFIAVLFAKLGHHQERSDVMIQFNQPFTPYLTGLLRRVRLTMT